MLPITGDETVTSVIPVTEFTEDQHLVLLTQQGYVKKTPLKAFKSISARGLIIIGLVIILDNIFMYVYLYICIYYVYLCILRVYVHIFIRIICYISIHYIIYTIILLLSYTRFRSGRFSEVGADM